MIGEVPKFRSRIEEYDPQAGIWTRVVKSNDILHIATNGSTQPTAAGDLTLATTTLGANYEALIIAFGYGASGAANFHILVGGSTIMPVRLSAAGQGTPLTATKSAPFYRVAASSVVSIIAAGASTAVSYNAFVSMVRLPLAAKLETE